MSSIKEESDSEHLNGSLESEEFQILQNQVDHLFELVNELSCEVSTLKRSTQTRFLWGAYSLFGLILFFLHNAN